MAQSENLQIEQLAQQFIDALHSLETGGDEHVQDIAEMFAEDTTLCNSALDLRGTEVNGKNEVVQFWAEYKSTLGQVKSEFHHITTSERSAGLFWTTKGQNPNGEEINYHGATLLEWNDEGLIQFFRGYYDTRELKIQPAQ